MAFHTEKDLKSKKKRNKKFFLAEDVNTEIKFEIVDKRPIFLGNIIQAVVSKKAYFFG